MVFLTLPEERARWAQATESVEKQFERQIGTQLLRDIHELLEN